MTFGAMARSLAERLIHIFTRDPATNRRTVHDGRRTFQDDPYWRDLILFYEYFHGDNGAGLGASHQTGWTGVIARLIEIFGRIDAEHYLAAGNRDPFATQGTEHRDLTPTGRG